MYSFRDIRNYIIKYIDDQKFYSPVRLIEMANRSRVPKWIQPAYLSLCMKPEMITVDEAIRLGPPVYTALCRIREEVLKKGLSGVMSRGRIQPYCHHPPPQNAEAPSGSWAGPSPWTARQHAACDQCVEEAVKSHVPEKEYIRLIRAAPDLNVPDDDEEEIGDDEW